MSTPPARLATALLQLFPGGVLICDIDGTIVEHNERAAELVARLAPAEAPEAGLAGRSVYDFFDVHLVDHARDEVWERVGQGGALPRAYFAVRLGAEQILRVQLSPGAVEEMPRHYVMVLSPVDPRGEALGTQGRMLQTFTESMRSSLASIRAAIETMVQYPEMDDAVAAQFAQIIMDQSVALSDHLTDSVSEFAELFKAQWALETMAAEDLLVAVSQALDDELEVPVTCETPEQPLRVGVESYSLIQALCMLVRFIQNAVRCDRFTCRVGPAGGFCALDVVWQGDPVRLERLKKWSNQPLDLDETFLQLTPHEVFERHGAEMWSQRVEGANCAYLRILLPAR